MVKRPEYRVEIVGENLKRLRKESGYSVEEIRDYLCLGSVQAVYKYENGRGYPPADALLALMELYGADVEDIITQHRSGQDAACDIYAVVAFYCRTAGNMMFVRFPNDIGNREQKARVRRYADSCLW